MGQYDDILHLPHHVSPTRPRMTMAERGAQFSSFAALSGYEAAIQETGRLTDPKAALGDEARTVLDRKLALLLDCSGSQPEVAVTYFVPDDRKAGGAYTTASGSVKKIDVYSRSMVFTDGTVIPLDDIVDMESCLFQDLLCDFHG